MVLNKNVKMGVAAIILVVIGSSVYFSKYKHAKSEALPKIDELVKESDQERNELVALYQKRTEFLLDWQKGVQASVKKLPANLVVPEPVVHQKDLQTKTEADLNHLDLVQNEVSELLTNYLQTPEAAKKRPEGLEKLEESINRKRHHYVELAFEASSLIDKFDSKRERVPVFSAEITLKKQGMWK